MKKNIAVLLLLAFLTGCSVPSVSASLRPSVPAFESSTSSTIASPPSIIRESTSKIITGKSGEFEYRLDEMGNAIITAWFGSGTALSLPGKLDGHPVKGFEISSEKDDSKDFYQIETIIFESDVAVFPYGLIWYHFSPAFEVDSQNPYLTVVDGVLFNQDMTVLYAFPKDRTGIYTVPESVKVIGDSAFYKSLLTQITLPMGLERIGRSAFYESALITIEVPTTVFYVSGNAFNNCFALSDIYIPNGDIEAPDGFDVNYNTKIHTTAGSALHKYAFDHYMLVETENNLFYSDPYVYTEKTVDSDLLPKIAANPCTEEVAFWLCRRAVGEYRGEDLFSDVKSTVDCYKGIESGEYDLILVPKIDGLLKNSEKYEFVKFAEDALVVCTKQQSPHADISSQKLLDLYLNGETVYWDEAKTQKIIPYMTAPMHNLFPLLKYEATGYTENVVRSKVVYEFEGISLYHLGGIHAMFYDQTLTVDGKAYTDSDYPFKVEYYAVFLKSQPKDGLVRKTVDYLTSERGQMDCVWQTLIGIVGDPGWI